MKDKKLFLFDMDGTLIDLRKGILSPSKAVKDLWQQLRAKGYYVMLASGRTTSLISLPLTNVKIDGYILSDGAQVIIENEELFCCPLLKEDVDYLLELAQKYNLEYAKLGEEETYVKKDGIVEPFYLQANLDPKTIVYEDHGYLPMKMHLECPVFLKEELVDKLDRFNLAFEDDYGLIEIRNKAYNKASALKRVLDKLDCSIEETYFFGDGFNDVDIFKIVGHPFVMKNANEKLYHYGILCLPVEQDGVSKKLQEMINNKEI